MESDAELVESFVDGIIKFTAARERNQTRVMEKHYNRALEAYDELSKRGIESRRLVAELMNDARPEIRHYAASFSKDIDADKAKETFRQLSEIKGLIGFSSKVAYSKMNGIDPFESGPPALSP